MPHHANTDPLYARICAFDIDEGPVAFGFVHRLARNNGWSRSYAARVVEEYKKFIYLCVTAGVPMTPSAQVDEAWHLHLTYTRSYWERLCREVLGCSLHHQPTQGGAAERAKFHAWYERTLAAYRAAFGAEPPVDIWPPATVRFGVDTRTRRINTARHWVIRKPRIRGGAACVALGLALAGALVGCSHADGSEAARSLLYMLLGAPLMVYAVFSVAEDDDDGDGNGGEDGDGGDGGDGCSGCGGCGCGCG